MKTLVVENITKTFKISRKQQRIEKTMESYKTAVNGLSFVANEGEIYGLLGPNGAGKTTTLRIISTLIKQDKGDVIIEGLNTKTDTEKVRAKIGFLTSELKLEDFFTPNYLFDYFGKLHNIPDDVLENRKKELFEKFGIEKFAEVKIADLSTGMKQKVSIVISIVHDPDVIIFDEPTNGLDPEGIKDLRELLVKLATTEHMGILISSHNLAELESFCTKVCIIKNGVIIESSEIDVVKSKCSDSYYIFDVDDSKKAQQLLGENALLINPNEVKVLVERNNVPNLVKKLVDNNIKIYSVKKDNISLEDAFLKKTGGNVID